MEIGSNDYRSAAEEHLGAAIACAEEGKWLTSHYLCGLSVECILRAHRFRDKTSFEGRHNLARLLVESGLLLRIKPSQSDQIQRNSQIVASRWRNDHRFAAGRKIMVFLAKQGAPASLSRSTEQMLTAAQFIVRLGVQSL